jgi:hypothetical protein
VKTKHRVGCAGVAVLVAVAVVAWAFSPRSSSLPGGYTYTYFPAGGHRYISAPGGIKKVGQEVLSHQVQGTVVSGSVRLQLGGSDVRTFRLDTATHEVTFGE